jgi:methylglutaconyl-CoA hydratase
MPDRYVIQRREGGVEYLTLNRPDVRNAFDERMITELTAWASAAREDRALRCVVIAGAGLTFSAGADIAWMKRQAGYTEEENLRDAAAAARMFSSLDTLSVPTIARVQGAALGGGAGLVAACDVAVAEEAARFGFTEVKLGILPAVISPYVLAKIGRSAARELFLTGARFSAARAQQIGLVHAVLPAEKLDEAVDGYVREILSAGPEAIAAAKALIRDVWERPAEEAASRTALALARRRVSPEGQEGLAAFLERRTPSWSR